LVRYLYPVLDQYIHGVSARMRVTFRPELRRHSGTG
jgi:hypothetical protein